MRYYYATFLRLKIRKVIENKFVLITLIHLFFKNN